MKVYSNQLISEDIIPFPSGIKTADNEWFFICNLETKKIITEPMQCSAFTHSPLTVVVADTIEECQRYMSINELSLSEYLEEN